MPPYLFHFLVRDWTRICYVIGFENVWIHPTRRSWIRWGFFFPPWRAHFKMSVFAAEFAGCVWAEAVSRNKKRLRIQKYPDTCGRSLSKPLWPRQRERHQAKGLLNKTKLCTCAFNLFTFLCRPLHFLSRIERRYFLITTSYLAGLFDIYILLHIWHNCVCFSEFSPMRTLCEACHKEFESH